MRTSVASFGVFGFLTLAALAACSKKNDAPKSAEADAATETTIAPVAIERLATPSREGASIVLGKIAGKKVAFIADEDTGTVRTIDLAEKREVGSVVLGGRPGQLLVMKEGQLAVALRDDSSVALIDAHADGTLVLGKKTSTASEPIALALSPDDATLYVATGFSHALEAFHVDAGAEDGALGERSLDVQVGREPRAVSISTDGKRAFVAHAATSTLEVVDVGNAKVAATDLGIPTASFGGDSFGMMRPMPMRHMLMEPRRPTVDFDALIPVVASDVGVTQLAFNDCFDCDNSGLQNSLPARFARQGYALAHVVIHTNKDGDVETFIVPHTEMMTGDPMIISSGYGGGGIEGDVDEPTERFTMSMLDAQTGKRKLLAQTGDARDKDGCHLPRGSATDGAGNVYVACFGSDAVMAFSVGEKSFETEVEMKPTDKVRFDVNKDGVVKAVPVKGPSTVKNYYLSMNETAKVALPSGPSGIALDADDSRLVSFSQIDGSVSLTPLDAFKKDSTAKTDTIKLLRSSGLSELASKGRKIFFLGWRLARVERWSRVLELSPGWSRRRARVVDAGRSAPNDHARGPRESPRSVRVARKTSDASSAHADDDEKSERHGPRRQRTGRARRVSRVDERSAHEVARAERRRNARSRCLQFERRPVLELSRGEIRFHRSRHARRSKRDDLGSDEDVFGSIALERRRQRAVFPRRPLRVARRPAREIRRHHGRDKTNDARRQKSARRVFANLVAAAAYGPCAVNRGVLLFPPP